MNKPNIEKQNAVIKTSRACHCNSCACWDCSAAMARWCSSEMYANLQSRSSPFAVISIQIGWRWDVDEWMQQEKDLSYFVSCAKDAWKDMPFADQPYFGIIDALVQDHCVEDDTISWQIFVHLVVPTLSEPEIKKIHQWIDGKGFATVDNYASLADVRMVGGMEHCFWPESYDMQAAVLLFKLKRQDIFLKIIQAEFSRPSKTMQRLILHNTRLGKYSSLSKI